MHVLIVGGAPADRRGAARAHLPSTHTLFTLDAATLPFVRLEDVALPPAPRVLVVDGIERAYPDAQSGGTRLV
ncbi:MAG TPA: hypothetical protein VKI43_02135, partial [Vicinamibacterales bacterium]|nr:hypothetical protein [Vicinamibacterales bacterium]